MYEARLKFLWGIVYGLTFISVVTFGFTGLAEIALSKETITMYWELFCVFFVTFFVNRFLHDKRVIIVLMVLELLLFSYLHEMLFPVLVNIIYIIMIISIGDILGVCSHKTIWANFLWGISYVIVIECILSLCGIGTNVNFLIVIAISGIICVVLSLIKSSNKIKAVLDYDVIFHKKNAFALSVIASVMALLIGRCNLGLDYDGYWYGLRAEYILNSGNGIYDRIMAVSVPNTYPKGYELLTLPLVIMPSYSFRLAFNIMIGFLIVLASHGVFKKVNSHTPLWLTAIMATIPGVMSMCTTMKQDSITLLLQILMLYFAIDFIEKKECGSFWLVIGIYLLSINMKTTALVFSSVIFFGIVTFGIKMHLKPKKNGLMFFIISEAVTLLLCVRTYILCGYPYTSLLNGLWKNLGFEKKAPYIIAEPTDSLSIREIFTRNGIFMAIKKVIATFVAPYNFQGVSTDHLRLAWGTVLPLCVLILVLCRLVVYRKKNKNTEKLIFNIYFLTWLVSVYSISALIKNDGNYYMLLYFLSILMIVCIFDFSIQNKNIVRFISPIVLANMLIFGMTGWAGAARFSNISLMNKGYFNHFEDFKKKMIAEGKENIYRYFEKNETSHVLLLGDISFNLLPCLLENVAEVSSNRGGFDSYESFVEYLKLTNTSEIYWDNSYVPETIIKKFIKQLIEDGYVQDYISENNNYIFVLDMNLKNVRDTNDIMLRYMTDLYYKYEVLSGEFYQDGFLGKEVTLKFSCEENTKFNFTVSNTENIKYQKITISVEEKNYEMEFNGTEIKNCIIEIPEGEVQVYISAENTFLPTNGDARELSVILAVNAVLD